MIITMTSNCNPAYSGVDNLLELLTKSKSLHILMVMDKKNEPIRFSNLKKLVDSSSTTISRRLKELEAHGLVTRNVIGGGGNMSEYSITKDTKSLSQILQSLFEWVDDRIKQ